MMPAMNTKIEFHTYGLHLRGRRRRSHGWSNRALFLAIVCIAVSCGGCIQPRPGDAKFAQLRASRPPRNAIWLDTLDLSTLDQEWSTPEAGKSVAKKPL